MIFNQNAKEGCFFNSVSKWKSSQQTWSEIRMDEISHDSWHILHWKYFLKTIQSSFKSEFLVIENKLDMKNDENVQITNLKALAR